MKKAIYSALAAILLIPAISYAADLPMPEHVPAELSSGSVRCVLQDSKGFIWTGTRMGLNRFDGTRTRSFFFPAIPSDFIFSLCEDKDGNIWIGTSEGLARYDYLNDRITIPGKDDGYPEECRKVMRIECSPQGDIWFDCGLSAIHKYDRVSHHYTTIPLDIQNCGKRFCFDRLSRLVICCDLHYLYLFDGKNFREASLDKESEKLIRDDELFGPVTPEGSDEIYIATKRNGLVKVDLKKRMARTVLAWNGDERPTGISLTDGRHLWISTSQGLVCYDVFTGQTSRTGKRFYTCVCSTPQGDVIVGSNRYGIERIVSSPGPFIITKHSDEGFSLAASNPTGMSPDEYGNIWVSCEDGSLLKISRDGESVRKISAPQLKGRLTSVCCDSDGLWIGTMYGLCKMRFKDGFMRTYLNGEQNRVISIFRTGGGQVLASIPGKLIRLDRGNDRFVTINEAGTRAYNAFAEDSDGHIYLGSFASGLYSMEFRREGTVFKKEDVCPIRMISSLSFTSDSLLCITGQNEIALWNRRDGSCPLFSSQTVSGMVNSVYYTTIEDGEDLWTVSENGIMRIIPKEKKAIFYSSLTHFSKNSFCEPSIKTDAGMILAATDEGLVSFFPDELERSSAKLRTQFTALYVGGIQITPDDGSGILDKAVEFADHITVGPRENSVRIETATPAESIPMEVPYILEGFDKTQKSASEGQDIIYENLPPGDYTLKIAGHKPLKITVRPPFFASAGGIALIILLALILIGISVLVVRYKENVRRKLKMQQFRRDFLSGVVHELKTPLTLIKSPLSDIAKSQNLSESDKNNLEIISNGTEYLDKLSRDLLDFINSDDSHYVVNPVETDIVETISLFCFNYSKACAEKGIKLSFRHEQQQLTVLADENSLNKILNNLMHNALKYASSSIDIRLSRKGGDAIILIMNDGERIPSDKREDIFKPFVVLPHRKQPGARESFGIGLPFARRLAILNGGNLTLSENENTEFILTLPSIGLENSHTGEETPGNPDSGRYRILVVDDNKGLTEYISSRLSDTYDIITALSAAEAIEKLRKKSVDLVITDIRMSGMNGIEFCRKISTDADTSHIPVIIVSASATDEVRRKCSESGASSFIEKPFTINYLKASISSILQKRENYRRRFLSSHTLTEIQAVQMELEDKDATFIKNLSEITASHLSDEKFGTRQLCEEMFLTYPTLIRKMNALLGMTPVEYIRKRRLETAAELLKKSNCPISDVCYKMGFNSLQYFSKCFKDEFGVSPGEYRSQAS